MSNYQAIGALSETLRSLLEDRMDLPAGSGGFRVSIGPPRSENQINVETAENPRVNLFLYRLQENAQLKNQEMPGQGNPGTYGFPPLSLGLYFLVTAFGTTQTQGHFDETLSHYLLGSAMRVFHDHAVVTKDMRTRRDPAGLPILQDALRDAYESIKLTLEPISMEDLSKVFTALTLPFRASAAYHASLIQIESQAPRRFPRPVQPFPADRRILVFPLQRPQITQVAVRRITDPPGSQRPWPYASVGDTLIITGQNFRSAVTRVRLGTLEVSVGLANETTIELVIPDATLPGGAPIPSDRLLQPGVLTIEVITGIDASLSSGMGSNQAVLMLVPRAATAVPNLAVVPRTLQITGSRLFLDTLSGETVVGRAVIPKSQYLVATPTQLQIALPQTLPGGPVPSLVSGVLVPFPVLPNNAGLNVTIGADAPPQFFLPRRPTDPADLAGLLEAALEIASGGPGFTGARVAVTSDNRVIIVPGQLAGAVTFAADAAGIADMLKLTAAQGATSPSVYLSGQLDPFPVMKATQPVVNLSIGGIAHDVQFATRPTTLTDAATLLEAAVNAFPDAGFATARAAVLDQQIVFLPGAPGPVKLIAAATDPSSASELQLSGDVLVRVRVNAAESIDTLQVNLTS